MSGYVGIKCGIQFGEHLAILANLFGCHYKIMYFQTTDVLKPYYVEFLHCLLKQVK